MDLARLLDDLDADQRAAVLSEGAPLCIVAPAGSGKTRVLTRRIARRVLDGSADERHVLALTFTRRAAGELTGRLVALGVRGITAGTFHGFAHRLLRQRWTDLGRRPPLLATNRAAIVAEVAARPGRAPDRALVGEVAGEIDWARARRIPPSRYAAAASAAGRRTGAAPSRVAEVYAAYEAHKRSARVVDFDDLLAQVVREAARDARYADALRWRFRHLFVDEFQDVNPLQHAFLETLRGGRDDLCVVGDPRQAIYGWNGADARWLARFEEHHAGATVVTLRASHRSTPQILSLAQQVLDREAAPPAATRPDGAPPVAHRFPTEAAEADGVARLVAARRSARQGWRHLAVLARTNAQLTLVAAAFARRGVPARQRGAGIDHPVVRQALDDLLRRTGPGAVGAWLDDRREARAGGEDDETGAWVPPDPVDALEQVVADAVAQEPLLDGPGLRAWLAAAGPGELIGEGDAVTLATFHAAKGLEWPTVVVMGAARGLVPHRGATGRDEQAEERRLFHVALTRAADELILTWAGGEDDRTPFLDGVDLSPPPAAPPPPRPGSPRRAPDPALVALRRWRADAARAAQVPERFVCEDDVLARLLAVRPRDPEALAAVVGPLAARRFGDRLLGVLAGLSPGPDARP